MRTDIQISTGHVVTVQSINREALPRGLADSTNYSTFYKVTNEGTDRVFMYLGKGYETAPREIVAWYPNSKAMWHSFGKTLKDAIEGAVKDGWLYA